MSYWTIFIKFCLDEAWVFKGLNEENGKYSNELEITEANQKQSRPGKTRELNSLKLMSS